MKFIIRGGKRLAGTITVGGMKNAATPAIAATLLTDEPCTLQNIPRIADVEAMLSIIRSMGGKAEWVGDNSVCIENKGVDIEKLDQKQVKRLRSSILFLGPLLTRWETVTLAEPGGCIIGNRPLDAHLIGLQKLGAQITRSEEGITAQRSALRGAHIVQREASVTGTENIIMAATAAAGRTQIMYAAMEPHVQDICHLLVAMGAHIEGIGTTTLTIDGGRRLQGADYTIIPDTIEAGTFLILGFATHSEITIQGARAEHMEVVLETLSAMGAQYEVGDGYIRTLPSSALQAIRMETRAYPGIPTDMQSLFGVLATQTQGATMIHETMFEGRLGYIQELKKMGADASVLDPHRVMISGPTPLYGKEIHSLDLRAGAALVIAALIASGESIIHDAQIIDRGYERIEERLSALGADIMRQG